MVGITNHRQVNLLDNRFAERPIIQASVYQDYFARELAEIEASWAEAREKAAEHPGRHGMDWLTSLGESQ
jgi:hypothetical protein